MRSPRAKMNGKSSSMKGASKSALALSQHETPTSAPAAKVFKMPRPLPARAKR